eukprot:3295360-Rhodomonas_salina.1
MSLFLAPGVHRKASADHPGSDQADDVESWVLSLTNEGPQSGPFLIVLAFLDPDGKRPGAVMVEQDVADVNGGNLLHPQGAQRPHSHDGR